MASSFSTAAARRIDTNTIHVSIEAEGLALSCVTPSRSSSSRSTKLDAETAECDQQVTAVGQLLTARPRPPSPSVVSNRLTIVAWCGIEDQPGGWAELGGERSEPLPLRAPGSLFPIF